MTWLPPIGDDPTETAAIVRWIVDTVQPGRLQVDEVRDAHAAALEVLERYGAELEPFAIYLRSFDLEALRAPMQQPWLGDDVSYVEFVNRPSAVESALAEQLAPAVPVITVANQDSRFVVPGAKRVPRLLLPDDGWRVAVRGLVARAAIVVVELVHLSPGLRDELHLLTDAHVQRRAVIAIGNEESDELREFEHHQQLAASAGAPVAAPEPVDAADASLSDFPRLIPIGKLVAGPFDRTPQLADLVLEAGYVRGLSGADRRARNDALGLSDAAAHLAMEGFFRESVPCALEALGVFAALGDRISIIGASADLALIATVLDDPPKACAAAAWMARAAQDLSPVQRRGLLHRFSSLPRLPDALTDPSVAEVRHEIEALFGLGADAQPG